MKNKLYKVKALVKQVLEECEEARNSDNELYIRVCDKINPYVIRYSFMDIMRNLEDYRLPPYESVRRTRQKVQAEYPHLRPCEEVETFRSENEIAYREFATNN